MHTREKGAIKIMSRKNAYNKFAWSNPGKYTAQNNPVSSAAKRLDQDFEAAGDHLMNKNHALHHNALTYASQIGKNLG